MRADQAGPPGSCHAPGAPPPASITGRSGQHKIKEHDVALFMDFHDEHRCLTAATGVRPYSEITGDVSAIPGDAARATFRILQEGITNQVAVGAAP